MAKFRKLIITTAGFDFLTQAVADNTAIAFSRVVLAAQNYTDEEIANLTALTDPMQAITNLGIVKPSPETIQITAMMSNSAVESGYSYSSIGLFVKSANGEEVLFAVSGADSPGDIPPNTSPFSARLELFLTVSNAEQITFTIDDNVICGTHGIYVGSGDMPEGYDIQIDPTGEALLLDNEMSDESENVPKTKVVKKYVDNLLKESASYPGCFYRTVNDQTEWLNPPMVEGVEYKTTERFHGKPVYIIDKPLGGTITNGTMALNIGNVHEVFCAEMYTKKKEGTRTYAIASSTYGCYVGVDPADYLYVGISSDAINPNEDGYMIIKYTKKTDATVQ